MSKKIMREVTTVYHGADGHTVLYGPGQRFPLDADLPDWVETIDVVVDEPEPKAAKAEAKPAAAAGGGAARK